MQTHPENRTLAQLDLGLRRPRWLERAPAAPRPLGAVYALAQDALLTLPLASGALAITSLKGTVVVTQEGDAEDHVLEAGQSFCATRRGLVVVWALSPAETAVSALAANCVRPREP